jgi:hypothetical protein
MSTDTTTDYIIEGSVPSQLRNNAECGVPSFGIVLPSLQ